MNHRLQDVFLRARFGCLFEARLRRHLFLPLLVMLVGCEQLRVQNLPSSKLFCDQNLVGVWQFDSVGGTPEERDSYGINDDESEAFAFLRDDCSTLYGFDFGNAGVIAGAPTLIFNDIRSFSLNGKTFMVAARDPERDMSDEYENGYFLLRYRVQSDVLLVTPGDVYSAARDIDASAVPGMVLRSKNTDGSSIVALITGSGVEIAQQLYKHNYYAKFGETRLRRANAADSARVIGLISEFQTNQRSKK